MTFHETRFPTGISFGSTGGPERRTRVVTLASGHEERNAPWRHSRRRYDAGYGVRSLADLHYVIAFFEARMGRLYGFRWKDWSDFRSGPPTSAPTPFDQVIGVGDGSLTTFQLSKTYSSGETAYTRPITKPVADSVFVFEGGISLDEGADYAVDYSTGLVTFAAAPAAGQEITAGFEFDVPVRFDTDALDINLAGFEAGDIPSIPITEVRL